MNAPERFGKYLLTDRIAVGGMAEIFKARTAGLGGFEKVLAIKRLHPTFCQDDDFIKMLIDEAKIAVQLSHNNICQIFDLDRVGEQYYISMEFVEGRDLYRLSRRMEELGQFIPLEICCHIIRESCSGLDFAHRKVAPDGKPLGIIHRDVSPQNILISWEGEVRIVDFGIAKATMRACNTESGIIKGKFYYMSPEQAQATDKLDHRSDIFSLGLVFYELLTGQVLYDTDLERGQNLLDRVRDAKIRPPSLLRAEIPPKLDQIIMRALAKEPAERYQSAAALGDAITRFLSKHQARAGMVELARFMRETFKNVTVGTSPIVIDRRTIMTRLDYRVDHSSLVFDGQQPNGSSVGNQHSQAALAAVPVGTAMPGPNSFDDDPFFNEDPKQRPEGSGVYEVNDDDLFIVDDHSRQQPEYDPLDDEVTRIRMAPTAPTPRVQQPRHHNAGPSAGQQHTPSQPAHSPRAAPVPAADEWEDRPTEVHRSGGYLAGSPQAQIGPLKGEAPLEPKQQRVHLDDDKNTVITAFGESTAPVDKRIQMHPPTAAAISASHGAIGVVPPPKGLLHSRLTLVALLFVLVLLLGGALALGLHVVLKDDDTPTQTLVVAPTEPQAGQSVSAPTPIQPQQTTYSVASQPQASVIIDGVNRGRTPITLPPLAVGETYTLRLEAEGHRTHEQPLAPTTPGTQQLEFSLSSLYSQLVVNTVPAEAAISINGQFVQNSPLNLPNVDIRNEYQISASLPNYLTAHRTVRWPTGGVTEPLVVQLNLTPVPTIAEVPEIPEEIVARTSTSERPQTTREEPRSRTSSESAESTRTTRSSSARTESRSTEDSDTARRTASREREPRQSSSDERRAQEPASDSNLGFVSVQAIPAAQVFVDGRIVAPETPLMNHELPIGSHRVKVYYISLRQFSDERTIRIDPGETRRLVFRAPRE